MTRCTPRCWGLRCSFRLSQALGPMVRPEPGSPDITLACLSAAEVERDRCCDGDLEGERVESRIFSSIY